VRRRRQRRKRGGTANDDGQKDDEDSHERNATPLLDKEAELHGLFFANQCVTWTFEVR
jgi:hypothetical protein